MTEDYFGKGAVVDEPDERDLPYDVVAGLSAPMTDAEWIKGYDIEKVINRTIPIKNQFSSYSCVGQAYSYYIAVLNAIETGVYDEVSAKAIYSQIFLPNSAGAYFRDGAKIAVDFGALAETVVPSLKNGSCDEYFMEDKKWITQKVIDMAKVLQAKEYRAISTFTIDGFAQAIRDNGGIVAGVEGQNNGTWMSPEPKPPVKTEWKHALYFGKYGVDNKGKWIATPNSWGARVPDMDHLDGWQKIREDYFTADKMLCPWALVDKPNFTIKDINMMMIKKAGQPTIYMPFGNVLVPFKTTWEKYQIDFGKCTLLELNDKEFAKYRVSKSVSIN